MSDPWGVEADKAYVSGFQTAISGRPSDPMATWPEHEGTYRAGYADGIIQSKRLDAIPAVSPDNDYEDTLARFSGLDVTLPYPGYEGRPVVEDFPLPAPAPRSNHLITLTAFLFGLGVGTVASALLG